MEHQRTELKYAFKAYKAEEESVLSKEEWEKAGIANFVAGGVDFNDFYDGLYEKGEFILLYFGAGWSPPCRQMTYDLHHLLYSELNKDKAPKQIEVIYCSADKTVEAYQHTIKKGSSAKVGFADAPMPWLQFGKW